MIWDFTHPSLNTHNFQYKQYVHKRFWFCVIEKPDFCFLSKSDQGSNQKQMSQFFAPLGWPEDLTWNL